MTREEATNWLKAISFVRDHHIAEALDMAIEALQTDLVRCKDCVWYYPHDGIGECAHVGYRKPVPEDGYCHNGEGGTHE